MTHLRKMMLEELERRNYAQTTIDCYIQAIEDFARHFRRPPDQFTPEHIREYQAYLSRERKLAASTVTQRFAALRFFYTQTIKKAWSVADTPYPKKTRPLPSLGPETDGHPHPRRERSSGQGCYAQSHAAGSLARTTGVG
jgi:integrase/recombinase XerD